MRRKILRNLAAVSAIFVVTFSIMMITNYFQVSRQTPLRTEIIETLKDLNENYPDNARLQDQIRELDLMSRKAYFIRSDRLTTGVYILAGMFLILIVSLRMLYIDTKKLPEKELDAIDDWMIKTDARKYISWSAGALTALTLIVVAVSASKLVSNSTKKDKQTEILAKSSSEETSSEETSSEETSTEETSTEETASSETSTEETSTEETSAKNIDTGAVTPTGAENTPSATAQSEENPEKTTKPQETAASAEEKTAELAVEISKITHNGFRGNNSNGISAAKNVPDKWDLNAGVNIAWKMELPRKGYNSPVINGNRVFLSGADETARELYCIELSSGKLLWTVTADNIAGSPATMPKTSDDTGLAASTVATNGKQVCAVFASGDLICADMDGKRLWAKNLGVPENHYGYSSSLLAYGNSLIVQYDNSAAPKVMCLDIATGNERWTKNRTDKISWSSPIIAGIDGKAQLILMGTPCITSYNPDSGEQNWRVECMSGEVGASPCSAAGVVFGASEYATLIAINAADGVALWKSNDYLPEVSSPVATKDHVFLATSYGVVACYDAKTGELQKIHELQEEFYSSPVIVEGKIYLFANSGKLYIFAANSNFTQLNVVDTGERTFATPAFTDGKIVVRSEKNLYCAF
ncbi:MAG: PQQ-binding-like beta-propeller repeat protein [Prevotellaceae bacterium]|jgi:outer membrane protein assembly factor BamB|nr:PQQ-binding-like beta-propeller repeat protein [Prevotellaceae bacterium]